MESQVISLSEKNLNLKKGHLFIGAAAACHGSNLDRVPLMLYQGGKVIYETEKFEELFSDRAVLEKTFNGREGFNESISKGKKFSVEYGDGVMYFVPEKMKMGYVAIAYFVPRDKKIYRKSGEKAVKPMYKSLKLLEKAGIDFDYEE